MKVVIAGLGLMGGSLALALNKKSDNFEIWGYDFPTVCAQALERKIIHRQVERWPDDCQDADLVFLATPIQIIEQQLRELNGVVPAETIVTDLGSTKQNVHQLTQNINFSGTFIGGHPMTGSEKSGLEAANPLLYENAVYILTGVDAQNKKLAETKLFPVLAELKARVLLLQPQIHDEIMAMISHLPQLVAVNLVNLVGQKNAPEKPYLELAAGGFRDLTRIASSNFTIWKDILERNKENVRSALKQLIDLLQSQYERMADLSEDFHRANYFRSQIPRATKGFLQPLVDVLVYVDDRPGTVAALSNALASKGIDIRDIELLKVREKKAAFFAFRFPRTTKRVRLLKF